MAQYAAYLVCIVKLNAALLRLAEYINRQGHLALQVTPSLSLLIYQDLALIFGNVHRTVDLIDI